MNTFNLGFFRTSGNVFNIGLCGGVLRGSMEPEECRYRPIWLPPASITTIRWNDQ